VIALSWILCALSMAPVTDGVLELRLEGPLEVVSLDGVRVPTRVLAELAPGETITVRVPWLPMDADADPKLQGIDGAGGARVEAVLPAPGLAPGASARRPLPRPVETPARVPMVSWWVFAAGLCAVLAARRRPMAAALIGAVFGAGLWALPQSEPERPVVAVLEVGSSGAWWVHVGTGELEPPASTGLELETRPEGASWEWIVDARDPSLPKRWARASETTALVARSPGPTEVRLDAAANGFEDLNELWRRSPEGEWSRHGSWDVGEPLPPAVGGGLLPTWLRSGASPGAEVWVGRLREAPEGAQEAWVRVILPARD